MTLFDSKNKRSRAFLAAVIVGVMIAAFLLTVGMASLPSFGNNSNGPNSSNPSEEEGTCSGEGKKECTIGSEGGVPPNILVLEIYGKTETGYLRETVADQYGGGLWTLGPDNNAVTYDGNYIPKQLISYTTKHDSSVRIKVAGEWAGFIPVVYHANQLKLENIRMEYYPSQQIFYATDDFMGSYNVVFTHFEFTPDLLRNSQLATDNTTSSYLQIPTTLKNNVQPILNQIGISGYSNNYEKIVAIQNFLRSNYKYDQYYNRAPSGKDPIEWFLLEEKRGVCANFNSAFVILLRASGIPSRMVAGFAVDSNVDYQEVRGVQAHAWAEVKFENVGWVEFDATGSGTLDLPPEDIQVPTSTKITALSPTANKGGTFSVSGEVTTQTGQVPNGLEVVISIMKDKSGTGLVCSKTQVTNGHFSVDCKVPITISVGDYNIVAKTLSSDHFKGSESDPVLAVNAETKITPDSPQSVLVDTPFKVFGQLTEREAETPLQNVQLTLHYLVGTQEKSLASSTNQTGYATFSFDPIRADANTTMNYTISYNGAKYYLPSETEGQIKVQLITTPGNNNDEKNDQTGTQPLFASPIFLSSIPATIFAISGVFLLYRSRKKHSLGTKAEVSTQETPMLNGRTIVRNKLEDIELAIVFPQITQPFPDVWEAGNALQVEAHLKKNSNPLQGRVKLSLDGANSKETVTDNNGIIFLALQINEKGNHSIKAEYLGNSPSSTCEITRNIKIVDYTEEIVSIFNETFKHEKARGAIIGEETTPREFQKAVISTFQHVNSQSLDDLVYLFEVADYSLLTFKRREYENMFLASLSVQSSSVNNKIKLLGE